MRNFKMPTLKQLSYRQLKKHDTSKLSHKQKIDLTVFISKYNNESDKKVVVDQKFR